MDAAEKRLFRIAFQPVDVRFARPDGQHFAGLLMHLFSGCAVDEFELAAQRENQFVFGELSRTPGRTEAGQ